ncbi:hypothetical protein MPER_04711, partial [Moniliophthora perniciosa FA553]
MEVVTQFLSRTPGLTRPVHVDQYIHIYFLPPREHGKYTFRHVPTRAKARGTQDKDKKDQPQKKKWEPPLPTRVGKKKRRGPSAASKLPPVYPTTRCRLRLYKLERIKDYLLLEEEFIQNQERLKPESTLEEKNEEDRSKVDDMRGSPMAVGTLEEMMGVQQSRSTSLP